jgi:hypothetical protein
MSLEDYLSSLCESRKKQFIESIGYVLGAELHIKDVSISRNEFVSENLRFTVEFGALYLAWEIAEHIEVAKIRIKQEKLDREAAKRFYSPYAYLAPKR